MIYQYTLDGDFVAAFIDGPSAIKAIGRGIPSVVCNAAKNDRPYYGYLWSYGTDITNYHIRPLNGEVWRDVVGYESRYSVSNYGRIWLKKYQNKKGKWYLGHIVNVNSVDKYGYPRITLSDEQGAHKCVHVHRIVATAFVENPNHYNIVNHKDENKKNNKATNLEWCTNKYNLTYGTRPQRCGEKTRKPIAMIDSDGVVIKRFTSLSEAAKFIKRSISTISAAAHHPNRTAAGYKWRYLHKRDLIL